jgi:hypothetical protein
VAGGLSLLIHIDEAPIVCSPANWLRVLLSRACPARARANSGSHAVRSYTGWRGWRVRAPDGWGSGARLPGLACTYQRVPISRGSVTRGLPCSGSGALDKGRMEVSRPVVWGSGLGRGWCWWGGCRARIHRGKAAPAEGALHACLKEARALEGHQAGSNETRCVPVKIDLAYKRKGWSVNSTAVVRLEAVITLLHGSWPQLSRQIAAAQASTAAKAPALRASARRQPHPCFPGCRRCSYRRRRRWCCCRLAAARGTLRDQSPVVFRPT